MSVAIAPNPLNVELESLKLRVTEIFCSIQGESTYTGIPTVFIRLTGCPLRCQYCDTAYAFSGGKWLTLDEIVKEVSRYDLRHVTLTGGEPLAQRNSLKLLAGLCDRGFIVSIETSGAQDVSLIDPRVTKVMDIKTPGSGEHERNILGNIKYLRKQDQVKFVICSRPDYTWSRDFVREYKLTHLCEVLFSPSFDQLSPRQLAEWMLEDRLPARLQIQLHKLLWGNERGR
ncbi:MAG: 7-carboxy-7-deazaguanine synthase QueE [Gammaproteobacteria bacterium]|nr:7-carboxy-7-deazaguanine synthase QueE [Gammaproteobacteria bacterium]MDE0412155.1 7-carboxy-7-deazaguanine synthase QueE [Gammaproteobacteria bacterium]